MFVTGPVQTVKAAFNFEKSNHACMPLWFRLHFHALLWTSARRHQCLSQDLDASGPSCVIITCDYLSFSQLLINGWRTWSLFNHTLVFSQCHCEIKKWYTFVYTARIYTLLRVDNVTSIYHQPITKIISNYITRSHNRTESVPSVLGFRNSHLLDTIWGQIIGDIMSWLWEYGKCATYIRVTNYWSSQTSRYIAVIYIKLLHRVRQLNWNYIDHT